MDSNVMFSIFMCARNAENTISRAIDSVIYQSCKNWELIMIDNGSEDDTWLLMQEAMKKDSRIRGIHLESGIGWAKGASMCMEYATGRYMTFLAADDFFVGPGSLSVVESALSENPDMVFVGYIIVELDNHSYEISYGRIPERKLYLGEDKIFELFDLMNNLYYNSFFHFVSLELLRKNKINFYEPFYADYEGITEAICRSSKIAVVDHTIYALTSNTSQTGGTVVWKDYIMQWRSVKHIMMEKGKFDKNRLHYIAIRIFNNIISGLKAICFGKKICNKEMNPINVSYLEKLQFMEKVLEKEETIEMLFFAKQASYIKDIFDCVKYVYSQYLLEGISNDTIKIKWIDRLICGLCFYDGEKFIDRTEFYKEDFENVHAALCNDNNVGMIGYELIGNMQKFVTVEVEEFWLEINTRYMNWIKEKIYELLFMAIEIKKRGRLQEAIDIVKECLNLLQKNASYLAEGDLVQISNDLKTVIDKW